MRQERVDGKRLQGIAAHGRLLHHPDAVDHHPGPDVAKEAGEGGKVINGHFGPDVGAGREPRAYRRRAGGADHPPVRALAEQAKDHAPEHARNAENQHIHIRRRFPRRPRTDARQPGDPSRGSRCSPPRVDVTGIATRLASQGVDRIGLFAHWIGAAGALAPRRRSDAHQSKTSGKPHSVLHPEKFSILYSERVGALARPAFLPSLRPERHSCHSC
jgi:hypothetical protein